MDVLIAERGAWAESGRHHYPSAETTLRDVGVSVYFLFILTETGGKQISQQGIPSRSPGRRI